MYAYQGVNNVLYVSFCWKGETIDRMEAHWFLEGVGVSSPSKLSQLWMLLVVSGVLAG